jgi:predicted RNA binding protein YcfA (HicA-like mRNA interferase family)
MKRRELLRHLERHGCHLDHEGSRHSIYKNPTTGRKSAVPRHMEIDNRLARKICSQLGIPQTG